MTNKIIYRRRLLAETKLINRKLKGNPIGEWENYYDNGNLRSKGNYDNNGKEIGYWESYYYNGNLYYKGNYNNGSAVGDFYYFNEDGSLREIINHDN